MIIDTYKKILDYVGLEYDSEGFIYVDYGNKTQLTIDGKVVVLPIDQQLKAFNKNEKMLFHPLSENILEKGEPKIIKKLRECLTIKFNVVTGTIAQQLLNIVISPEMHKKLDSDQMQILTVLKDVDNKAFENFSNNFLRLSKKDIKSVFVNSYIKRGGIYKGKKYSRVSVTVFPFYEQIDEMKIRKKDKEIFKDLLTYIFPEINEEEAYNYGSNSRIAPFLDALMMGSLKVAENLNDVTSVFASYLDDYEKLTFSSEWFEDFQSLESFIKEIRKIPNVPDDFIEEEVATQPPLNTNTQLQQQFQQPVNTQQQIQPQQPAVTQQQQQPTINKEEGIEYKDLIRMNPMLGASPNAAAGLLYQEALKNNMVGQQQNPVMRGQQIPIQQQSIPVQQQTFQQPMQQQPMPVQQQAFQQPMQQQPGHLNNFQPLPLGSFPRP